MYYLRANYVEVAVQSTARCAAVAVVIDERCDKRGSERRDERTAAVVMNE